MADDLEEFCAGVGDHAKAGQFVERQPGLAELADGQGDAMDRERRHNDVDARSVRKTGVANRRGFVDAPSTATDHALAETEQLVVIAKVHVGRQNFAVDLDEAFVGAVNHDVADVVARQQRFERPETQHVVADVFDDVFLFLRR